MIIARDCLALAIIVTVSIYDLLERRAPDVLTLGGLLIMLGLLMPRGLKMLVDPAIGALVGFGVLFIARYITHQGLGLGDVKFAAFLGAALGPRTLLLALLLSGTIALTYLFICFMNKNLDRHERIPFVPFLGAGAVTARAITILVPSFLI